MTWHFFIIFVFKLVINQMFLPEIILIVPTSKRLSHNLIGMRELNANHLCVQVKLASNKLLPNKQLILMRVNHDACSSLYARARKHLYKLTFNCVGISFWYDIFQCRMCRSNIAVQYSNIVDRSGDKCGYLRGCFNCSHGKSRMQFVVCYDMIMPEKNTNYGCLGNSKT